MRGPGSPRHALPPGPRARQLRRLDRLLPDRPLARRPGRGGPLARPLPEPRARLGVPDIDLDFPRDIREKLIVARHRAATAASTRRSSRASRPTARAARSATSARRSACRSPSSSGSRGSPTAGTRTASPRSSTQLPDAQREARARRAGARFGELAREIAGLPRHISQHPGGMVISTRPLVELVPVQPAAMAGRQICQWDKDSCADAGFLKIDLLGLGMLSAVEDCVERIARAARRDDRPLAHPARRPGGLRRDPARPTPSATSRSRAARRCRACCRTRPENLDDLTVQVALVRPGPIQGKAVHPYIDAPAAAARGPGLRAAGRPPAARASRSATRSASSSSRTRCSTVAMALAGFSVGEAEGLRRAMSRKREPGGARGVPRALRRGRARGTASTSETADRVYDKLVGFSGFGFPKSHAAAFGLLAYQSAWLRHHYPAEFLCALLNAQPMGFYPPASLVRDAQRRGVEVRPPDVNLSDGALRRSTATAPCASGSATSRSVGEDEAKALVAERERGGPFAGVARPRAARAARPRARLEALVVAGACDAFGSRGASCSGSSASSPRAASGRRLAAARSASSRSRSTRPPRRRSCPSRPSGSGCSPTTGTTTSRSASTRSSCCARTCRADVVSSRELPRLAHGRSVAVAGMASRASGRRPRTASSSCCSRTSSAR